MTTATPLGEVCAQVPSEQRAETTEDLTRVLGDIKAGPQAQCRARGRLHGRQQPAPESFHRVRWGTAVVAVSARRPRLRVGSWRAGTGSTPRWNHR